MHLSETDEILTLTHATERDVDLLLVEELKCSPEFVRWFSATVLPTSTVGNDFARWVITHSKRRLHSRREIDITLTLHGPAGRGVILVENKLDTSEQASQAESYRDETKLLMESGQAITAVTTLVCPQSYARANPHFAEKFDSCVHYEQIISFLEGRMTRETGELASRLRHRCELLRQAVTKSRRGYEAVPLIQIEAFNAMYVAMVVEA